MPEKNSANSGQNKTTERKEQDKKGWHKKEEVRTAQEKQRPKSAKRPIEVQ